MFYRLRIAICTVGILLAAGCSTVQTQPAPALTNSRVEITLPHNRVNILEGEKTTAIIPYTSDIAEPGDQKFSDLKLQILQTPSGHYVPEDFNAAVSELRKMLPDEYLKFLLADYGYVASADDAYRHRDFTYEFDDRILDLSKFLHIHWNLYGRDTQLAREIDCLGNFEFDLTPLYLALARQEAFTTDGQTLAEMGEAFILLNTLLFNCLEKHADLHPQ
ncbi:hypothetical protein PUV54_08015 [Hyphococcus flavus]|uniref:Lipoprotein n=1 Tax=Hyphococcus flavus TaxID=1866326 RepID=A0AAE9ZL45_9PROT|nr:hypothetical protein [Hyphococcus flavus]WDI33141.1 hypothetical protein PUV54_08015 [Hyphococcus flavus]